MKSEYQAFLDSENQSVPEALSNKVLAKMESLLNPNAFSVFTKIFGIHLVVGTLSLLVCHQFGVNPFETSFSLDHLFMRMGGFYACMIFCGILFVSLSLGVSGLILSIEEVKALKRTEFLQTLSLGVISLGIFFMVGAELALTMAGLWLLGALIGGIVATEVIWKIKSLR